MEALDWLLFALKWLAMAISLSPFLIGIGWVFYEGSIRPRRVPREEIEAMADAVMRDHPEDPEGWVDMEEHAAWYRSLSFEQGKWHRVRMVIRRRRLADAPPSA